MYEKYSSLSTLARGRPPTSWIRDSARLDCAPYARPAICAIHDQWCNNGRDAAELTVNDCSFDPMTE